MSTTDPTSWEDQLSAENDPDERRKIATDAVQESLIEAQRRAAKVVEIETARGDDQHPAVAGMATHTAALLDPILGMWKH